MDVEILGNSQELEHVEPFRVETLLWGTKKIPETYGYLGYVPEDGFYLKMVCREKDPLRTYIADQDPVYQDSAMEAFFLFDSVKEREGLPLYVNFEVNATIYDEEVTGQLEEAFMNDLPHCREITKEEYRDRNMWMRIKEQSSRLLSPLL